MNSLTIYFKFQPLPRQFLIIIINSISAAAR